jgi:hypothetical protein
MARCAYSNPIRRSDGDQPAHRAYSFAHFVLLTMQHHKSMWHHGPLGWVRRALRPLAGGAPRARDRPEPRLPP